ncbi:MAG: S1C family serine protease [Planctomycetota bacterium]|jgi:S1-C subfamily serine protease|nr:S1C family serine protease [Planctomycetota bacterium]
MNLLALLLIFPQQVQHPDQQSGTAAPSFLGTLEAEMTALHQKLRPSLLKVRVRVAERTESGKALEREILLSGVALGGNGLFVAPAIPVAGAKVEAIRFDSGVFPAESVAHSQDYGISLYRASGLGLKAPLLGSCAGLQVGSVVVSLGNAFGLDATLDVGFLAGVGRKVHQAEGLLQMTNSVNPGDGGGILADRNGKIIGVLMTSLKEAALHEEGQEHEMMRRSESLSFAIPLGRILAAFPEQLGMLAPNRPRLGVLVVQMPIDAEGEEPGFRLVVKDVLPHSPAEKAGVQAGDELLGLCGCALNDLACLQRAITQSGKRTILRIKRGEKQLNLQIQFGAPKE